MQRDEKRWGSLKNVWPAAVSELLADGLVGGGEPEPGTGFSGRTIALREGDVRTSVSKSGVGSRCRARAAEAKRLVKEKGRKESTSLASCLESLTGKRTDSGYPLRGTRKGKSARKSRVYPASKARVDRRGGSPPPNQTQD